MEGVLDERLQNILKTIEQRQLEENAVIASHKSEILSKLGIKLSNLPIKTREHLRQLAKYKDVSGIENMDPISVLQWNTSATIEKFDTDYEILKLKQRKEELDLRIKQNDEETKKLQKSLADSKNVMKEQSINPDNIMTEITLLGQKIKSYEQNYEKTKQKFSKLNVPTELYPKSLQTLIDQLVSLQQEEIELKERADNITLARKAKMNLLQLRQTKF